jgi:hypothetical protein
MCSSCSSSSSCSAHLVLLREGMRHLRVYVVLAPLLQVRPVERRGGGL